MSDVFAVFSPTTNATGGFVGWECLALERYERRDLTEIPNKIGQFCC